MWAVKIGVSLSDSALSTLDPMSSFVSFLATLDSPTIVCPFRRVAAGVTTAAQRIAATASLVGRHRAAGLAALPAARVLADDPLVGEPRLLGDVCDRSAG